jgi:hypothetical protein
MLQDTSHKYCDDDLIFDQEWIQQKMKLTTGKCCLLFRLGWQFRRVLVQSMKYLESLLLVTNVNSDPSKTSRKGKLSMASVMGHEKSINDSGRGHGRVYDEGIENTEMTEGERQRVSIISKTDARSKPSNRHPIQELTDSMANVSLCGKNTNGLTRHGPLNDAESAHRMGPFPPKGFVSNTIITSMSICGSSKYTLQKSLQKIENRAETDLVLKIFREPTMMDVVTSQSFSLGPSESMLLEDNTVTLIDIARRCLKLLSPSTPDSTSEKSGHSNNAKVESELALLRVALYSLRAILPTILESDKSRSTVLIVIKLFFNCVVIAGDVCHGKIKRFTAPSISSSSEREGLAVIEYAIICLGAYEGLGKCLKMGSSSTIKKGAIVWDELIRYPGAEVLSASTILPHRQHMYIAIESTLRASSSFLYLSLMSLHAKFRGFNEQWAVPNEFYFSSSVIGEACSGEHIEIPTFQKLLNVAHPFIVESLFMADEDNDARTFNPNALKHVRRGFRILRDGAQSVEGLCTVNDPPALRICSVDLQCEAIHFLLLSLKRFFNHCPDLLLEESAPSTVKEIFALFDRASSSATKAAGIFRNVAESDATKQSAFVQFHRFVGAQLDFVAKRLFSTKSCGEAIPLPPSYYEYCAYRSIHLWRLLKLVDNDHNLTSLFLDKNRTKRISCEESESMAGAAISTLIHMVLVTLQSLIIASDPTNISDSNHERIISCFERIVINNSTTASQNRCRSILAELDLQMEASKIISSAHSGTSYSAKGQGLSVLASVLRRCYAPLETKLSQSTKDQARRLNFRLASADCYAKSASLYGVASEDTFLTFDKLDEHATNADSQLRTCFEALVNELSQLEEEGRVKRKKPTILAIEMFAKVGEVHLSVSLIIPVRDRPQCIMHISSPLSLSFRLLHILVNEDMRERWALVYYLSCFTYCDGVSLKHVLSYSYSGVSGLNSAALIRM